ncbi:rod shape-determining protein MreD [Spongiibacter sp. KMU-158]|uniref:Rod shape-determining protein MreD n=1 Tax=Spongiibacter pelagi TaxID=2760804 RepID=A0A927GVK5_9GAMM|nr:rod shape-determining protein MreD [Spongiibacter pelagi]MBD2858766.1 rod shape-determining protein MreD [Spongiibacter pelagi]
MVEAPHHGYWFVLLCLIGALLMGIVPHEGWLTWGRPDWVLLVCAFWLLALPDRFGLMTCWFIGLTQDVLTGAVLGQHAFSLVVIAYIFQVSYQRLRMFGLNRQAGLIALLCLFRVLVDQWAQSINGLNEASWWVFLPVLTTALLWLVLRPVLRRFQYVFEVS